MKIGIDTKTNEQSKTVQSHLFKLGVKWASNDTIIRKEYLHLAIDGTATLYYASSPVVLRDICDFIIPISFFIGKMTSIEKKQMTRFLRLLIREKRNSP